MKYEDIDLDEAECIIANLIYEVSAKFYHSWNRNIVPNCPESWEPLKKVMQPFV